MKTLFLILALAASPFAVVTSTAAQSLDEITRALGAGDIDALAAVMDSEIELSLPEDDNLYGKAEATGKLRAFFSAHPPAGFSQVHQGSSKADDAEYCIGNLATQDGSYRVYIYIARKGNRMVLQELRFDRE